MKVQYRQPWGFNGYLIFTVLLTACVPPEVKKSNTSEKEQLDKDSSQVAPNTVEYTSPASMPAARHFHRACTIGAKVYVFGESHAELLVFDIKTNAWQSLGPIGDTKIDKGHWSGAAIDGKLYFINAASRRLLCLDPVSKKWSDLRKIPNPRVHTSAVAVGKKIYVLGGYSSKLTAKNSVEVYGHKQLTAGHLGLVFLDSLVTIISIWFLC